MAPEDAAAELQPHEWRAPFSAASDMCGAPVMRNGGGDECGLLRDHPVHTPAARQAPCSNCGRTMPVVSLDPLTWVNPAAGRVGRPMPARDEVAELDGGWRCGLCWPTNPWMEAPKGPDLAAAGEHDEVGWAYGVIYDDLGDCGCGYTEDRLALVRQVLRDCPLYDDERWRKYDSPLAEWMLSIMDSADLIEHGTSIQRSWITDKGKRFLAVLEDEVAWRSLTQGDPPVGYCAHCLFEAGAGVREIAKATGLNVGDSPHDAPREEAVSDTACEWCGRAVEQDAEGRWYAIKGEERGYDPLACDASEDGRHEA